MRGLFVDYLSALFFHYYLDKNILLDYI